jgi:hypothetical protein
VLLSREQGDEKAVRTVTRDLSSSGFYCVSKAAFAVGERLLCILHIPVNSSGGGESLLECRVVVVRVDADPKDGTYGIACHTEDYRFAGPRQS